MGTLPLKANAGVQLPTVLIVGWQSLVNETRSNAFRYVTAHTLDEVFAHYKREEVSVLVLGPRLSTADAVGLLSRCRVEFPNHSNLSIVVNVSQDMELFQDFIDSDEIFYLARGPLSNEQLESIVAGALSRIQAKRERTNEPVAVISKVADELIDFPIRLSELVDAADVIGLIVETTQRIIKSDAAQCLIYEEETETLWTINSGSGEERRESAAAGLVGYVARTGEEIRLDRIGIDARYDAESDLADTPDHRFIARPVTGANGALLAVVSAVRNSSRAPFSQADTEVLSVLARYSTPTLSSVLLQKHVREVVADERHANLPGSALFREEALEYHNKSRTQEGHLLTDLPAYLRRSYLIIVLLIAICFAYISIARVDQNVTGLALIRTKVKTSITARNSGLVSMVAVSVGDQVKEGDILVRFQSTPGDTLLDRLKEELRAPVSGTISDVRIRSGQELAPGDQVASITDGSSGNELIALLPGAFAPQIRSGMPLILRLQEYPDCLETLQIDSLSTEIVGPQEAARYVGRESIGALEITGPILIAHSALHKPTFEADGRTYSYHDGMVGQVDISVRSDPIVLSLIPGLKEAIKRPRGLLKIK